MDKEMETDDLTLARYLRVEGAPMIRTYKRNHRIHFVFDDKGGRAQRLADMFYNSRDGKRAHDLIRQYRLVRDIAQDIRNGVRV
jgi:Mor family transcriptional regulator